MPYPNLLSKLILFMDISVYFVYYGYAELILKAAYALIF